MKFGWVKITLQIQLIFYGIKQNSHVLRKDGKKL